MFIKTLRAAGAGLAAIVLVNGQLLRAESSSLTCDFSGRNWTLRKSSGGKTGGPTIRMRILNSRVKLWRAKKFRGYSSAGRASRSQ
jgi:hypothetical protein